MIESLHNHTTLSDGKMTPKELFELAESIGLGVVAYTDHDALPDHATLEYLESVRKHRTKWIIGIEITARPPKESGDVPGTVHIVGLFVDPANAPLQVHCKKAQIARVERMQVIVSKLRTLGFVITEEDCIKESGGESVGRPHIVNALAKYPQNDEVMHKLIGEMEIAAKQDSSIALQYQSMLEYGKKQYPYALFLSPNAFKPAYVEVRYLPTFDEAVALIRHAGGMAFFAHYSYDKKKVPLHVMRDLLKDNRIDGAEVVYGFAALGTPDEPKFAEDRIMLRSLINMNGRLMSGGADAHEALDLRRYASRLDLAQDSSGLSEQIIATGRVEVKNSSLRALEE